MKKYEQRLKEIADELNEIGNDPEFEGVIFVAMTARPQKAGRNLGHGHIHGNPIYIGQMVGQLLLDVKLILLAVLAYIGTSFEEENKDKVGGRIGEILKGIKIEQP